MCLGAAGPEWMRRKFAGIWLVEGGVRGFLFLICLVAPRYTCCSGGVIWKRASVFPAGSVIVAP